MKVARIRISADVAAGDSGTSTGTEWHGHLKTEKG